MVATGPPGAVRRTVADPAFPGRAAVVLVAVYAMSALVILWILIPPGTTEGELRLVGARDRPAAPAGHPGAAAGGRAARRPGLPRAHRQRRNRAEPSVPARRRGRRASATAYLKQHWCQGERRAHASDLVMTSCEKVVFLAAAVLVLLGSTRCSARSMACYAASTCRGRRRSVGAPSPASRPCRDLGTCRRICATRWSPGRAMPRPTREAMTSGCAPEKIDTAASVRADARSAVHPDLKRAGGRGCHRKPPFPSARRRRSGAGLAVRRRQPGAGPGLPCRSCYC